MLKRLLHIAIFVSAIFLVALPAYASLVPMSWGFPSLVQNSSLTDFSNALSQSNDYQLSNISFPTTGSGVEDTSFPTISQVSNEGNLLSQYEYEAQDQYSQFAYPWLSIGDSPVPSMGSI
jgi:hypothetical protein